MKQLFLASLISFCSVHISGALADSDTSGKNRQDFIDSGAHLQVQSKANHNLHETLRGRPDAHQHDRAGACNDGHGECGGGKDGGSGRKNHHRCTPGKLTIRKEWRFLSKAERRNYIEAVYCLRSKPSLFTEEAAPSSKSLFDSFTVVHITQTPLIHENEKALRDECGYRGASPYWEWGYDVHYPQKSALFDGSPYSLGSNGAPLAEREPTFRLPPIPHLPQRENILIPAGTGGGCVMFGPFSDLITNIGPVAMPGADINNPLRYNPRCLMRDLNPHIGQKSTAFNWSTWTIEENSDTYASPHDPAFFLHHAQIDRLWSIWQWLDIEKRRDAIYGTRTLANTPVSRNRTLEDIIDMRPLEPPLSVRDVMSTIDGPLLLLSVI